MTRKILHFFDKLEDRVRSRLSHYPIFYSLLAAVSIVLFWRGIWDFADAIHLSVVWSLVASTIVLLMSGLFVSFFVGDAILISGLRREKKLIEKTEDEIDVEGNTLKRMQSEISREESALAEIKREITELRTLVEELRTSRKKTK